MDKHLLNEMIEALEDYRSSMHYAELFGNNDKLPCQKNLERIINQAKAYKDSWDNQLANIWADGYDQAITDDFGGNGYSPNPYRNVK